MKKLLIFGVSIITLLSLSACQDVEMTTKDIQEKTNGIHMIVRTYDENSNVIDKVEGKSLMIDRDTRFDSTDSDGTSNKDSSVVDITIGKNEMIHVGSSLIAQESGLTDIFNDYAKNVNIKNEDTRGMPLINKIINRYKDSFEGKKRVILVRSQNGTPLATYAGNKVTPYSTDVPKSTALLIDGKLLLIYRSDYTIYDTDLLK